MHLEHYVYFTNNNFQDYEFYSEGPKGKIKKVVRFTQISETEPIVYNLGFGDATENDDIIDDNIVSNNKDRDIVLATVANTIIDFIKHHGNHYIYATGSTPSRTRLYQIGIAGLWHEINQEFDIYGLKNNSWNIFQKNVNYDAFLVKKK